MYHIKYRYRRGYLLLSFVNINVIMMMSVNMRYEEIT